MINGIIKRYDYRKGFGFIVDDDNGKDFFFHKSAWQGDGPIRKGVAVEFLSKDSDKGPQAESVMPLDGGGRVKASGNNNPAASLASLEERLASLESSIATLKVLSGLALAGVIVLAVLQLVL